MSNQWKKSTRGKRGFTIIILLISLFFATNVLAEKVVFEDVSFLFGADGKNNAFTISEPGTYQATLVDFDFPSSFDNLDMNITKGAVTEVDRMSGEGSLIFDATPGLYFANVFGSSNSNNSVNASLYGLKIAQLSVSAVPIPTAIGMFGSALLLYVGFGSAGNRISKKENQEHIPTNAAVVV